MNETAASPLVLDMGEVHGLSVAILNFCEQQETTVGAVVAALALSLGRVLGPDNGMQPEEEVKFVQTLAEYAQLYFTDGKVN